MTDLAWDYSREAHDAGHYLDGTVRVGGQVVDEADVPDLSDVE
jgi:hypothetical protein